MNDVLTGIEAREALQAFNMSAKNRLSEEQKNEFNRKIQNAASGLGLSIQEYNNPLTLPKFVLDSNSRLYRKELKAAESTSPTYIKKTPKAAEEEDAHSNQFFKNIYSVTGLKDGSSFFVMQNGVGNSRRVVSEHWTKESIDKCAEMIAKSGGRCHMLPLGEPGALPAHLRAYATAAFKKHGLELPDPTPPNEAQIEMSRRSTANSIALDNTPEDETTPTLTFS